MDILLFRQLLSAVLRELWSDSFLCCSWRGGRDAFIWENDRENLCKGAVSADYAGACPVPFFEITVDSRAKTFYNKNKRFLQKNM